MRDGDAQSSAVAIEKCDRRFAEGDVFKRALLIFEVLRRDDEHLPATEAPCAPPSAVRHQSVKHSRCTCVAFRPCRVVRVVTPNALCRRRSGAAVYKDGLAGDVGACRRCEHDRRTGDFIRLAKTAERECRLALGAQLGVFV